MNPRFKEYWYYTFNGQTGCDFWRMLRYIKSYLTKGHILAGNIAKCDDLFIISHLRKDYLRLFQTIYQTDAANNASFCEIREVRRRLTMNRTSRIQHQSALFKDTKYVEIHTAEGIRKMRQNIWARTALFLYYLENAQVTNLLKSQQWYGIKRLIVLCDIWPIEAIMVEKAKTAGIVTVSCQHGISYENLDVFSPDKLNYTDISTKYYLAWGENTKKLREKHSCEELDILVCGNPILVTKENKNMNNDIIGIVLDVPSQFEYNVKIVDIVLAVAKRTGKKVVIRPHPQDKLRNYAVDSDVVLEGTDIERCGYIIGHTTTMLYTCMLEGHRVFKYKSDIRYPIINDAVCFQTEEELQQKMNSAQAFDYIQEARNEITFWGKEAGERYQAAWEHIS